MTTEITIRKISTKDSLKDTVLDSLKAGAEARIRELADKLSASYPAIEHVRVVVDTEGQDVVATLSAQGGQATNVEALAKDPDAGAAVNALFDKADAQLRRAAQKRQDVRK